MCDLRGATQSSPESPLTSTKKNLRTGTSVWALYPAPRVTVLRHPRPRRVTSDVLLVGAGISGAVIGEMLSARGLRVAMVDRRGPVKGSTPASTALVQYEIDTPLLALVRKVGRDRAERAWRRTKLSLDGLAERTEELGIACDAVRRNSLYLSGNELSAKEIEEEAAARRAIGLETRFLEGAALRERFGFRRSGALLTFGNLAVNPRQMAAGYLKAMQARGGRIFAPETVTGIEEGARAIHAASDKDREFEAESIIFASGYERPTLVKSKTLGIVSTWAMATHPQPRRLWPEEVMIWEASSPYLYLRTTPDGRIICGGEDETVKDDEARDALTDKKIAAIRKKLHALVPGADTRPATAWSAFFGESRTGLPAIGLIPGHQRVYAAMGYGGNGITYSRVAAELLAARLLGERDPDEHVFAFGKT